MDSGYSIYISFVKIDSLTLLKVNALDYNAKAILADYFSLYLPIVCR